MPDQDFRSHQRDPDASNLQTLLLKLRYGQLIPKQIELAARLGCEDSLMLCQTTLRCPITRIDWLVESGQARLDRLNIMVEVFNLYEKWYAVLVFYACALLEEYARPFAVQVPEICSVIATRIPHYRASIMDPRPLSQEAYQNFGPLAWPPNANPIFNLDVVLGLPEDQEELIRRFYRLHIIFNMTKGMWAHMPEGEFLTYQTGMAYGINDELILGISRFANQLLIKYALGEDPTLPI